MGRKVSIDYIFGKLEEMEKTIDRNFASLFEKMDKFNERMNKNESAIDKAKGIMIPIASTAGIIATAIVNFLFGHWGAK
jgi:short-subunit dehydrogenase